MASLLASTANVIKVTALPAESRETCEKLLVAMRADFAGMASFLRINPRAELGGITEAWVSGSTQRFHVPINGVKVCDTRITSDEAAQFRGSVGYVEGKWTLSVPIDASGGEIRERSALFTTLVAALVVLAALFAAWPAQTMLFCRQAAASAQPLVQWCVHAVQARR